MAKQKIANPADAAAKIRSAMDLLARRHLPAARGAALQALKIEPNSVDALQTMGAVLTEMGQFEDAQIHLRRAVQLAPARASAHFNLAKALDHAGLMEEALAEYEIARRLAPEAAQVHLGLGNLLQRFNRLNDALQCYAQAVRFAPDLPAIFPNAGRALAKLDDHPAAIRAFDRLMALEPGAPDAMLGKASSQQHLCDWKDYAARISKLVDLLAEGRAPGGNTFFFSTVCDDNAMLRRAAAQEVPPLPDKRRLTAAGSAAPSRIRVAYMSGDFRPHAVAFLSAGLFEAHDRERFEVIGISLRKDEGSPMRQRLLATFDRFEEVEGEPTDVIARRIRDLGVDVLVDLVGYTTWCRPSVFRHRPAPVQVNFLGYPGTLGIKEMDYIVVDPFIATDDLRKNVTEKLVVMPHTYQCNDDKRQIADAAFTRADEGLPETGFVFCCFNQTRKITPPVFDVWMRILGNVEGSVLWLLSKDETAIANLRREAVARGIAPERLVFAKHRALDQHLARTRLADLVLDTFPYGAHTTASDALWAGVPVLTVAGNSFASRVCGSLLHAVGLPELVKETFADYEALAIQLARDPAALGELRSRLAANRSSSPLFDTRLFARNIERAYEEMVRLAAEGKAPVEIDVRTLPESKP